MQRSDLVAVDAPVRFHLDYELLSLRELVSIVRYWDAAFRLSFRDEARRRGKSRLPRLDTFARKVSTPSSTELVSDVVLAVTLFTAIGGPVLDWRAITRASVRQIGQALVSLSESRLIGGPEPSSGFPELPSLGLERGVDVERAHHQAHDIVIAIGTTSLSLPLEAAQKPQTVKQIERLIKSLTKADVRRIEIEAAGSDEKYVLSRRDQ